MRGGCLALSLLALACMAMMVIPPAVADTSPPIGAILFPGPGTWSPYSDVSLRVRFTDPDGIAASSISMWVDGKPLAVETDPADAGWTDVDVHPTARDLGEGTHTAEASVTDRLGNGPTVLRWSFSVDTIPPVVNITYPVGNPVVSDGSMTLAWTGSDSGSGIDTYTVQLDDGPAFGVGKATSVPFRDLRPGVHYFSVNAYDVAGNSVYTTDRPIAMATVPAPSGAQTNTTHQVTVAASSGIPAWAVLLVLVNAVEVAAVAWLALRRRRVSPGRGKPGHGGG